MNHRNNAGEVNEDINRELGYSHTIKRKLFIEYIVIWYQTRCAELLGTAESRVANEKVIQQYQQKIQKGTKLLEKLYSDK